MHLKRCAGLPRTHDGIWLGRKNLRARHPKTNSIMRKFILLYIRRDKIYWSIQYDPFIIEYENKIISHLRGYQHKANIGICMQLRRLGRIKIELQVTTSKMDNLSDFLRPSKSEKLMVVVEQRMPDYIINKTHSSAEYGNTYKNHVCNNQNMHMHIKNVNRSLRDEIRDFLDCFSNDYKRRLSRLTYESHGERHCHVEM